MVLVGCGKMPRAKGDLKSVNHRNATIAADNMRRAAWAGIALGLAMLAGCQTAATLTSQISGRPLPRKVAQQMYRKDPAYYGRRYTPSGDALVPSHGGASVSSSSADAARSTRQTLHPAPASQSEDVSPARNKPRDLSGIPFEQLGQQYRNYPWIHPSEVTGGCTPQKLESFKEQARWVSRDAEAAAAYYRFLDARSVQGSSAEGGGASSRKDYNYPSGKRASGYEALGY